MLRFVRQYSAKVVICLVLLTTVCGVLSLFLPMLRERAIARELVEAGGSVHFGYIGPNWVPTFLQDRWTHVVGIEIGDDKSMKGKLKLLGEFRHLWIIDVGDGQLSEADWQVIVKIRRVKRIDLRGERVTDAELERLKTMSHIIWVMLQDTRTTPEGRAKLRKARPACWVAPYP